MSYTRVSKGPADAAFLISEANGFRSRDVITLKSGSVYATGSVIEPEMAGEPAAATGYWVLAADTADTAAVLLHETDATAAHTKSTAILRDAEVKGGELVLKAGIAVASATAILAATGIIVRTSIHTAE